MTAPRWSRADVGYCSNVHGGEELADLHHTVARHVTAVREERGLQHMAAGLWLPAAAAHLLDRQPAALEAFRATLGEAGIRLVTANGFPHGGFHRERVKHAVYHPDWSTPDRLSYTLALARVLAACAPADAPGEELTLSTLPVAAAGTLGGEALERAYNQLVTLAAALATLRGRSGRHVRVCLEPEPGCLLETSAAAARLLAETLPARARSRGVAAAAIADHLGVCYDVCHQAVMFESVDDGLATLAAAGVRVGKVQVSSALRVADAGDPATREALARFDEPRYLHQVRWRDPDGAVRGTDDLDGALADGPRGTEWRVHFHVPIQAANLDFPGLATTRDAIDDLLVALAARPDASPHLEVETYTWSVLPPRLRPATPEALTAGLGAELDWLEGRMERRGLLAP